MLKLIPIINFDIISENNQSPQIVCPPDRYVINELSLAFIFLFIFKQINENIANMLFSF